MVTHPWRISGLFHYIQSVEGLFFITQTLQMYEIKSRFQGTAPYGTITIQNASDYETYGCFINHCMSPDLCKE